MVDGQMKQDNIVAQKNFTFAVFFMPFCLVNPNNCVNTHTHRSETNIKVRAMRANIQQIFF